MRRLCEDFSDSGAIHDHNVQDIPENNPLPLHEAPSSPPPPNPSPLLLKSYSPPQRPDPENFNELRRGYWRTNSQKGYSKFWCFQSHCGWHEWSEMKTFLPLGLHKNFCFPCTVVKRAKVKNGLNFIHLHIWHTQRNVTKRLFAMNWFTSYLFRE